MSLLRNVNKCIANQEKHATLNAFLHLAQDGAGTRRAAEEADGRALLGIPGRSRIEPSELTRAQATANQLLMGV